MTQRFGAGHAAVEGADHHLNERVSRLIQGHFPTQDPADIDVNMFAHRADRLRVRGRLDRWNDRVTDDVALTGREDMHDRSSRADQRFSAKASQFR